MHRAFIWFQLVYTFIRYIFSIGIYLLVWTWIVIISIQIVHISMRERDLCDEFTNLFGPNEFGDQIVLKRVLGTMKMHWMLELIIMKVLSSRSSFQLKFMKMILSFQLDFSWRRSLSFNWYLQRRSSPSISIGIKRRTISKWAIQYHSK